jgi:hypothetical protein
MNYWIFQGNPTRFDVADRSKVDDGKQETWLVSRYRELMHAGDVVFLWRSGETSRRGIYAWGIMQGGAGIPRKLGSGGQDIIQEAPSRTHPGLRDASHSTTPGSSYIPDGNWYKLCTFQGGGGCHRGNYWSPFRPGLHTGGALIMRGWLFGVFLIALLVSIILTAVGLLANWGIWITTPLVKQGEKLPLLENLVTGVLLAIVALLLELGRRWFIARNAKDQLADAYVRLVAAAVILQQLLRKNRIPTTLTLPIISTKTSNLKTRS